MTPFKFELLIVDHNIPLEILLFLGIVSFPISRLIASPNVIPQSIIASFYARNVSQTVGMNFFESSSCWLADSGNAARPAIIPTIMRSRDMMDQITPQH